MWKYESFMFCVWNKLRMVLYGIDIGGFLIRGLFSKKIWGMCEVVAKHCFCLEIIVLDLKMECWWGGPAKDYATSGVRCQDVFKH